MQETERGERGRASAPLAADSQLLGASGAGWTPVEALRAEYGLPIWAYTPHRPLNDVHYCAGMAFVSTRVARVRNSDETAYITALRGDDGAKLWETNTERLRPRLWRLRLAAGLSAGLGDFSVAAGRAAARALRLVGRLSLAGDGETLVASTGGAVFAFDAATGAFRWAKLLSRTRNLRVHAVHQGSLYVDSERGGIDAINLRTGTRLWVSERIGMPLAAVGDGPMLHVNSIGRGLTRPLVTTLQVADGTWVRSLDPAGGSGDGAERFGALADDGVAFLVREGRIRAVRLADGAEVWQAAVAGLEGPVLLGVPVVAVGGHHIAYARTEVRGTGRITHAGALDRMSGAVRWHWQSPERPLPASGYTALAVAFGNVYLATPESLYGFSGDGGQMLWAARQGFEIIRKTTIPALDATTCRARRSEQPQR